MKRHLPAPACFIGKPIPGMPGYVVEDLIGSGCNAHVFRAFSATVQNHAACKIIPQANLVGADDPAEPWKQEIHKAQSLESPVVVKFWHIGTWRGEGDTPDCAILCSQFVNGTTLEDYVKKHKNDIAVPFVERFLRDMLVFFDNMIRHGVSHGDLHSRNILVEDQSNLLGTADCAFRVTDFGVTTATSVASDRDDFEMLGTVLRTLLSNVDYQLAGARDRYAFNVLNDHFLARHLSEHDPSRDPFARNPEALHSRLAQIDEDHGKAEEAAARPEMLTPFDFLSCEQIGESHGLLRTLYSDKFLGIADVEARSNLVLTGPRGCGKSTVFKSLSLRHRDLVEGKGVADLPYIGVYYRCDDLYAVFPRYALPENDDGYDIPVHYLTASLTAELLNNIEQWGKKHFPQEFDAGEQRAALAVWESLGLDPPSEPGGARFRRICARMQKERKRASQKQRFLHAEGEQIGSYFGPDVLGRVCKALESGLSFLRSKYFYFFIDDYSAPKITLDLQKNLNRLVMQRSARCFFKLSTESPVSYYRGDLDGKSYVEGREFAYVNLGLVYLSASTEEKLDFIEDVLTRRFGAVPDFPVKTLEALVGSHREPSHNEVAIAIRKNQKPDLWGKQALCELCSGDVFYVISLVGRMVRDYGEKNLKPIEKPAAIPPPIQVRAIRGEAGSFLDSLRGIHDGEHLVHVVTAFGNVAYSYLRYRNSKNKDGKPPHLASRIEPYEQLHLGSKARRTYTELLRYSLFIEDPRGKSRRGKVVPRLYIRRALIPHFNLTFSRRDSVELENSDVELLLTKPERFEEKFRLKSEDDVRKAEAREKEACTQTVMEGILNGAENPMEGNCAR